MFSAFREGTQYTEVIKFNYAGAKMKKLEKLLQAIAVDVIFWAFGAMVIYFTIIAVVVPLHFLTLASLQSETITHVESGRD